MVAQGEPVLFEGVVDDPDVPQTWLTVTWDSDVDGVLQTQAPSSDGTTQLSVDDLSVAPHRITMTATDEVVAACSAAISLTVGTRPILSVTSPTDGDRLNAGDDIQFTAVVSDEQDSPQDIQLSWRSDQDGHDDILIGAPYHDGDGTDSGKAYLVLGDF